MAPVPAMAEPRQTSWSRRECRYCCCRRRRCCRRHCCRRRCCCYCCMAATRRRWRACAAQVAHPLASAATPKAQGERAWRTRQEGARSQTRRTWRCREAGDADATHCLGTLVSSIEHRTRSGSRPLATTSTRAGNDRMRFPTRWASQQANGRTERPRPAQRHGWRRVQSRIAASGQRVRRARP